MEMAELRLTQGTIDKVKKETVLLVCDALGEDIKKSFYMALVPEEIFRKIQILTSHCAFHAKGQM